MASADGLFLPAELSEGGVPVSVAQLRQGAHHRGRNQASHPDDAPGVRLAVRQGALSLPFNTQTGNMGREFSLQGGGTSLWDVHWFQLFLNLFNSSSVWPINRRKVRKSKNSNRSYSFSLFSLKEKPQCTILYQLLHILVSQQNPEMFIFICSF